MKSLEKEQFYFLLYKDIQYGKFPTLNFTMKY